MAAGRYVLFFFISHVLIYVSICCLSPTMNIVASAPIPIFYWKDDLDSFLAANGVKSFLGKNPAKVVPVGKGDTITELDGKYPIFVGVHFSEMATMPDIGGAMNCVILSRYDQSETLLADWSKLPTLSRLPAKARAISKKVMRWKLVFDDYQALTRMGYTVMSSPERALEVMPPFIKHLVEIFEKPEPSEDERRLVTGTAQHPAFLANDYPTFENEVFRLYDHPHSRSFIVNGLVEVGKRKLNESKRQRLEEQYRLALLTIDRTATTTEFAGHQVKIAHLPSELAHKAGWLLARNMPFAVVFEDLLKENKRVYHLYSTHGGMNVLEVAAPYNAKGTARYATFTLDVDFSNQKFV